MNLISLLYLDLRAKRDWRRNRLRSVPEIPDLLISSYVQEQINDYYLCRQRLIARQKYAIELPDKQHQLCSCRVTLDSGLDALDSAIASLTGAITSEGVNLEHKLNELDQKRKIFIRDQAPHLVQLCDNQENKAWNQYYKIVLDLYAKAIKLLGFQVQLITDTEARLANAHARYTSRIGHYYAKLSHYCPGKTFRIPSQDDLAFLGDPQILSTYHMQKRTDILHRRISFQQTLDDIQSRLSI